ncbi:MAG TPA: VOC family protein [Casimicrobiaceae bacterium]|nr:VOC family protein [Casimicrobiaceae bacterium]
MANEATTMIGCRPTGPGVHSVNQVVFSVPDLSDARRFYDAFGLEARANGAQLDLYSSDSTHCWVSIHQGNAKRLEYVSFGIFAQDEARFRELVGQRGLGCAPHRLSDGKGVWLRDPDGVALQLVVASKVSPTEKAKPSPVLDVPRGKGAAPARSRAEKVRPRHLSHVLRFTPDVPRMVAFCRDVLGLCLSDHSGDVIAFTHSVHGSDHHLLAFAKSNAPGLHHTSWDVGSLDEVGRGSEQMRNAGYTEGWGVGRHVVGSNYFYYARDPWGSWVEYSFDIDHIPAGLEWPAMDHPPEDSFYVWGPPPHPEFIVNHEAPA